MVQILFQAFFPYCCQICNLRAENDIGRFLVSSRHLLRASVLSRVCISIPILKITVTHTRMGRNWGWWWRGHFKNEIKNGEQKWRIYNYGSGGLRPFCICVTWNIYFNRDSLIYWKKPLLSDYNMLVDIKAMLAAMRTQELLSRNLYFREEPKKIIYKDWFCLQEKETVISLLKSYRLGEKKKKTVKVSSGS